MIGKVIDALRDQSWGPGIMFVQGLCLVTSDGGLFPWGNIAGIIVLGLTVWMEE